MLTLEAAKITAVRRSAAASRRSAGVAGIGLRHDAIRNCPISNDFFCSASRLARCALVGRRPARSAASARRPSRQVAHPRHIAAAHGAARRLRWRRRGELLLLFFGQRIVELGERSADQLRRVVHGPKRILHRAEPLDRREVGVVAAGRLDRRHRIAQRGLELIECAALRVGQFDRAGDLGDRPVGRGQVHAAAGRRRPEHSLVGARLLPCPARVARRRAALGANAVASTSPMPWTRSRSPYSFGHSVKPMTSS